MSTALPPKQAKATPKPYSDYVIMNYFLLLGASASASSTAWFLLLSMKRSF